jgi:fibronectin-binding autotransporter adhesin
MATTTISSGQTSSGGFVTSGNTEIVLSGGSSVDPSVTGGTVILKGGTLFSGGVTSGGQVVVSSGGVTEGQVAFGFHFAKDDAGTAITYTKPPAANVELAVSHA